MNRKKIDDCLEVLSLRGCTEVWEIIRQLEAGQPLQETAGLSTDEKHAVLHELKSIMSVYAARKGRPNNMP